MTRNREPKSCAVCGREMVWRKRWAKNWDNVRYCSDACRKRGVSDIDTDIEEAILNLLSSRARGASACPSEIARVQFPADWRQRMEVVRSAARRLESRGQIEILQNGRPVDASRAKGPIRLRLVFY